MKLKKFEAWLEENEYDEELSACDGSPTKRMWIGYLEEYIFGDKRHFPGMEGTIYLRLQRGENILEVRYDHLIGIVKEMEKKKC